MNTSKDLIVCQMRIPFFDGAKEWSLAIGTFRRIPIEDINSWLMPYGRSRSDRDLAQEVLIEIHSISQGSKTPLCRLDLLEILNSRKAVAVIVSTYLSILPRRDIESISTIQSLRP